VLIYKATNITNGKVYIGQTTSTLNRRKSSHISKSLKNCNSYFHNALRKYEFKWDILCYLDNIDDLNEMEMFCIDIFNSFGEGGYNLNVGGGSSIGRKLSQEEKDKISKSKKGSIVSDKTKLKMSDARKGKVFTPHSQETKNKISKSTLGRICSVETRVKLSKSGIKYWKEKK